VLAELGPIVVDSVQVQSKRARADDVCRVLAEHVPDFHLATAGRQVRGHVSHQLLAALGNLATHVPQFAGGEPGAQLMPHYLPLSAVHVEQPVSQRVLVRLTGVHAVVGEVSKVADQYSAHELRVVHHQVWRAHLVEPAVPVTAEPVVNPAEHARLVFVAQGQPADVAEQRHRRLHVRDASVSPVTERGHGEVVRRGH